MPPLLETSHWIVAAVQLAGMVPSLTLKVAAVGAVTAWALGPVSIEGEVAQAGAVTVKSAGLLSPLFPCPLVSAARNSSPDSLVARGVDLKHSPWWRVGVCGC